MGKIVDGQSGQLDEQKGREAGGAAGEGGRSTSTKTTSNRRGTGTGAGKGTTEKANVPRLVAVDLPTSEGEEKPSTPKKTTKKTPKKATAASKKATKKDVDNITMFLNTVNVIVSSRPNMQVWSLTEDEIKQLSDPIANIIKQNDVIANMTNEHSDYIALGIACFTIFIPKFFAWYMTKPKKEGAVTYGTTTNNKTAKTTGSSGQTAGQTTTTRQDDGQKFGGHLHDVIAATSGF